MPSNFDNPSRIFSWFYSLFCPIYGRSYYKKLLKALKLNGNESVLDFGSGAGILAKKIINELSKEGKLTCLDLSEAFLRRVRKKLRDHKNVDYLLGDIRKLNIPSNTFDIITISWVIHHLPKEELSEFIQTIVNTLKKEGKVYVIEFLSPPHGISEEDLLGLFNSTGLSESELFIKKNTGIFEFKRI
ncbi:MAG: class I SAM-dependent methyltransferase [Candidatus Hermodarchaeota archaeon]